DAVAELDMRADIPPKVVGKQAAITELILANFWQSAV
ncbi:MAG: hypothetical protein RLY69_1012, partial [Verrucomicrobiota bacterium]